MERYQAGLESKVNFFSVINRSIFIWLIQTVLLIFLAHPSFALTGDFDGDCNVDRDDLIILLADRNKSVVDSACGEACDLDGDGVVTVLDSRKLVLLCTQSRCAVVPNSCQANEPPVAHAGPDQTVHLGETVALDGSGSSDIDGDPISFSWTLHIPQGSQATLSDPTAIQPTFVVDHQGPFTGELVVNDGEEDSAPDQVVISTVNSPPVALIHAIPSGLYYTGQTISLDGSDSYDADSDPLTYSWVLTQQPATSQTLVENSTSDIASITLDEAGEFVVQLIVNDGQENSAPTQLTITTNNTPPVAVIEQAPVNPVYIGENIQLDGSSSSDGDNDPLFYDWVLTSFPSGSHAGLSPVVPPNDGSLIEITPDIPGDYLVQLIVNDSFDDSTPATQLIDAWTIVPDLYSIPRLEAAGAIDNAGLLLGNVIEQHNSMSSGLVYDQDPAAGDILDIVMPVHIWVSLGPEQIVVPSVVGLAQATAESTITGANLIVGSISTIYNDTIPVGQVISQTPTAGTPVDANSPVNLVVSLGSEAVNNPPQLLPVSNRYITINQPFSLSLFGIDPDRGDALTYAILSGPEGMGIESNTGAITWLPATNQVGEHQVRVQVADTGGLTDQQEFFLTTRTSVLSNVIPTITTTPVKLITQGQSYVYDVNATDEDGDVLSYSLLSTPAGMTINSQTGVVNWTPADVGSFPVIISVDDGQGGKATQGYILEVEVLNVAPEILSTPVTEATEDRGYSYQIEAQDTNGDTLTYALLASPTGMTINESTGLISWLPTVADIGAPQVSIQVADPAGLEDVQTFTLIVSENLNSTPIAEAGVLQKVVPGTTVVLDGSSSYDPDGDPLTYKWSLTSQPEGSEAVLSDASTVAPSFNADIYGQYILELVVNDGAIDSVPDTVTIIATLQVVAGSGHTCALAKDGGVQCWGRNYSGELGIGVFGPPVNTQTDPAGIPFPVTVIKEIDGTPLNGVTAITADRRNTTCALTDSGEVLCWGWNYNGDLGDGTIVNRSSAGNVLVKLNGPPLDKITSIEMGIGHTCAITVEGGVKCWGWGNHGQLGNDNLGQGGVSASSLSPVEVLAELNGEPLIGATAVSAGDLHTCAIMDDTTVKCWGNNDWGQLGNGADLVPGQGNDRNFSPVDVVMSPGGEKLTGVVRIAAGGAHTCALMDDTGVKCWGSNSYGQIGDGVVGRGAGDPAQGTINTTPVDVLLELGGAPLAGVVGLITGGEQTCAVMDDTGVKCWGLGNAMLANGISNPAYSPMDVLTASGGPPLSGVSEVAIGGSHACAAMENGEIKCWGSPLTGAIGNGEVYDPTEPSPSHQYYPVETLLGQDAVLAALAVSPTDHTLAPGTNGQYTAIGILSDGTTENLTTTATWESDNPTVATVDNTGLVTALGAGVTNLRVTHNGLSRSTSLMVAPAGLVAIEVQPESAVILSAEGRDSSGCRINDPNPCRPLDFALTEQHYTATGIYQDGTRIDLTQIVNWTVTGSAASIAADGLAIGIGLGQSTISASRDGLAGTALISVHEVIDADTTPPVSDLAPGNNTLLTGLTDILATVSDTNLLSYELKIAPPGTTDFEILATGTTPINDIVTTVDSTLMENGLYTVSLTASDKGGNVTTVDRTYQVQDEAKVGLFQLAFVDLAIPVSGIPIEVIRTYDSRVKSQKDFGIGWDLAIRRGSFKSNRVVGEGWQVLDGGGIFGLPCQFVSETAFHSTEVRLSDDEYYSFQPVLSQTAAVTGGCTGQVDFQFVDGTIPGATLEVADGNGVFYENGTNRVLKIGTVDEVFNPNRVRLTTPDGRIIDFDNQAGGVVRVEDINSNTLDISDTGITHSSGKAIVFTRDALGRIIEITDPMGNSLGYLYDTAGDLIAFTDQAANQTTFSYDNRHNLINIFDPLGNRAIQSEYDTAGRLVATTDAEGNRTELAHDLENRREAITDSLGRVTVHEYDEQGNILITIDALGNRTNYIYDANGNELTVADPLGNVTTNTYDASNNLLTETDPLGNVTVNSYTIRNQLQTAVDPLGNTTTYIYPLTSGNLEGITDPLGNITGLGYDRVGNMNAMVDPLGNTTSFIYDDFGNRISQTDKQGNVTTYTFDNNGNELTESTAWTDPEGNQITLLTAKAYDNLNRLIQVTDPLGNVTQTEYNGIGKVSAEIDKLGRRTEYAYDSRGNKVQTQYPDGSVEKTAFDSEGNQVSTTDRQGRVTSYSYDALNRLVQTTYPDGSTTQTVFDAAGREIVSIDANGNQITTEYDAAGNRTQVIDALGYATSFQYDAAGRQTSIADANGEITRFEYDATGRLTRKVLSDGTDTLTSFDSGGRLTAKTDAAGTITSYEYDAKGRLLAVIDALGQRTQYGYDEQGNLVSQTDANGNTTRYEYNELGQRTATVLPMGQRSSSTYDAAGNLINATDFNGDTISYSYNANNQLISKLLPDGTTVTFTYTDSGQRASVTDSRGVTSYTYDLQDRLLSRTDPGGESISYTYDAAGNRTSVSTPSGTTSYTFDELNRIETVTAPDGGITTYQYGARGELERTTLANANEERRFYDDLGRLLTVESSHSPSDTPITRFSYTLDLLGNRVAVDELDGRRVEYQYDLLSRLTSEIIYDPGATLASRTISYTFDNVGNRLTRDDSLEDVTTYVYDNNDRLLNEDTAGVVSSYSYDNNGNTLSKTTNGVAVGYTWNGENRLVAADMDGDGSNELDYSYDVEGIRIAKGVNGIQTRYLIDANRPYAQVLEELDTAGTTTASYIYGNDLLTQQRDSVTSYYHVDGLGSSRALSNTDGASTDFYTFDAYGQIANQLGTTDNLYLYAGEQRDFDIGLDYLRARYLDVASGRFVSRDSFEGIKQRSMSLHRYLYANASPSNFFDPSGKVTLSATMTGLAGRVSLRQIFSGVWLQPSLKGGATLLALKMMEPGIQVRNTGMLLVANGFDFGIDVYLDGNQMIAEAASFLQKAEKIIDYADYALDAIGIMREPVLSLSGFSGAILIDPKGVKRFEILMNKTETAFGFLKRLASNKTYAKALRKETVDDISELLFELEQLAINIYKDL